MIPRRLCLLLFTSLLPAIAQAQSATTDADQKPPIYDVEIVVFKNLRVPRDQEFVLPVSSPGKSADMFDISSAQSIEAVRESGYELLPADQYRLLDQVARLIESPRYELLLHAAWRQPGLERDQALPVWIKGGRIYGNEYTSIDNTIEVVGAADGEAAEDTGAKTYAFDEQSPEAQELKLLEQQDDNRHGGLYELEGKITVALSRYLHTYADLILRKPQLSADQQPGTAAEEAYLQAHIADTRILDNHLLQEHRRMRSKNLHYLDNPEFGILILITPYEVAEGFVEEAIEEEPAPTE